MLHVCIFWQLYCVERIGVRVNEIVLWLLMNHFESIKPVIVKYFFWMNSLHLLMRIAWLNKCRSIGGSDDDVSKELRIKNENLILILWLTIYLHLLGWLLFWNSCIFAFVWWPEMSCNLSCLANIFISLRWFLFHWEMKSKDIHIFWRLCHFLDCLISLGLWLLMRWVLIRFLLIWFFSLLAGRALLHLS